MSGPTVTFNVNFARKRESRLTRRESPRSAPVTATEPRPNVSPIARLLALAHHVERLVENGTLKDYADAARHLDMAKSHMTHIMSLLRLAPDIQAGILDGRLNISERLLRPICRLTRWNEQRDAIAASHLADCILVRQSFH